MALNAKIEKAISQQVYYAVTKNQAGEPTLSTKKRTVKDAVEAFAKNSADAFFVKHRLCGDKTLIVDFMKKNGFTDLDIQEGQKYALTAQNVSTPQYKKLLEMDQQNYQRVQESLQDAVKASNRRPLNPYQMWVSKNKTTLRKEVKKDLGASGAKDKKALHEAFITKLKAKWNEFKASADYEVMKKTASKMKQQHKRRSRDVNQPKRPQSAYFLWASQERSKIKTANPTFNILQIASELGKQWKVLPATQKKRFNEEADKLKTEYKKKMEEYKQTVAQKKETTVRRPTSGFFFYLKDIRDRLTKTNPTAKITEISKLAKTEWDALKPADRVRYLQQSLQDKKRYTRQKEGRPVSPLRPDEMSVIQKIHGAISPVKTTAPVASRASPVGKKK